MTVDEVIAQLPRTGFNPLPASEYSGPKPKGPHVGLAVPSMRLHTTDEGWQLFLGLESAGYLLQGYGHPFSRQHIPQILLDLDPSVLFIQDRREWEGRTAGPGFDQRERYTGVSVLKGCHQVFKVTVVKDAQHEPAFHFQAAEEMGIHAWVIYYHPRIVCHLAPYLRPQHLIRTYHSVDSLIIPPFDKYQREGCLVSGAVSSAYPFRKRVFNLALNGDLPGCEILKHPGYGRSKCYTPDYLDTLSNFKVAFCDSSRYGYALRKLIEATACGCAVITDLPVDEVLPEIDENLRRVEPDISSRELHLLIQDLEKSYDPGFQKFYADKAKAFYDYREVGRRLAADIESMRKGYNARG